MSEIERRDGDAVGATVGRVLAAARVPVVGGALWALAMALSAAACLWLRGWLTPASIGEVALLYGAGAAVAFPVACLGAATWSRGNAFETRFAGAFVLLTSLTIAVTAVFYAFDYRVYYAAWHDDVFTVTWFIQLAFTTAGALGQFAVTGVRLYFPFGFIALLVASLWFALRSR